MIVLHGVVIVTVMPVSSGTIVTLHCVRQDEGCVRSKLEYVPGKVLD